MLTKIAKFLSAVVFGIAVVITVMSIFIAGFSKGYAFGKQDGLQSVLPVEIPKSTKEINTVTTKVVYVTPKPVVNVSWGGPQLWEAVNKRRVQLGVGSLGIKEEVCTIASIRLNQLLELGKLDAHKGFSTMAQDRPDLKYIFDKYNLAEFLVSGASSPQNAVDLWENTLGHKELLSGGQYVWGCIYAQNGFGVAITAY